jgi:hypothetical protein
VDGVRVRRGGDERLGCVHSGSSPVHACERGVRCGNMFDFELTGGGRWPKFDRTSPASPPAWRLRQPNNHHSFRKKRGRGLAVLRNSSFTSRLRRTAARIDRRLSCVVHRTVARGFETGSLALAGKTFTSKRQERTSTRVNRAPSTSRTPGKTRARRIRRTGSCRYTSPSLRVLSEHLVKAIGVSIAACTGLEVHASDARLSASEFSHQAVLDLGRAKKNEEDRGRVGYAAPCSRFLLSELGRGLGW